MESVVYNRENLAKFRSACQSLFDILSSVEDDKERYKPYSPLELDMKLNNAVSKSIQDRQHSHGEFPKRKNVALNAKTIAPKRNTFMTQYEQC